MIRKLRVLMVMIDLHGGAGVFCRNLATGLRRHFAGETDLALLLCRDRGRLPGDEDVWRHTEIFRTTVSSDWRRYAETVAHTFQLHEAIERLNPDLIVTVGTYANLLVPVAAPGRPCVLTVHSNMSELLRCSPFEGFIRRLIRSRYPRHVVVSPSAGVSSDLRGQFGVTRSEVIPHGIDVERIVALSRRPVDDLPVPCGEPYFVAIGRLTRAKDYPTMLRAYALARAEPGRLRQPLVIIGDGEEQSALRSLAGSLGLVEGRHLHFLGHRNNPYPYLARAQAFVMSSAWEGFGLALLEAMVLGLPCLATDCPSGPGEILGGGQFGRLVPPGDPAALASAMLDLSSLPERLAFFGRQGAIRSQAYTLERMARQYYELFLQILSSRSAQGRLVQGRQ